ncbi:MAG TPA: N-acetylmuramoyl-L-alanine amidase [Cytophagales bacterium]|nr:N-acetylmuramoyl-L-alanine amidase [Cytophagales bacterium]
MSIRLSGILSLFFLLTFFSLKAQPFFRLDSPKIKVQNVANLYVDPNGKIKNYYSIENDGVSIFSSLENKLKNKVECKVYWDEVELFQQLAKRLPKDVLIKLYQEKKTNRFSSSLYFLPFLKISFKDLPQTSLKPLSGFKIAIDPGHVSGDMNTAALETKYLNLQKNIREGIYDPINLIEGNLTLATAFFLKKQLEAAGAEVMLTRDKPNYSSFGITYQEWLSKAKKQNFETAYHKGEITLEEKNRFLKISTPKEIFQKHFRFADLYERARIINAYKPDFTVIIHYNVDEQNSPWTSPTSKNYNMVFVPGDLKPEFLDQVERRLELLRMLVSDDIFQSISLSTYLIQSFEKVLEVPPALPDHASYLKNDCTTTPYHGVYVRNLALTRLVHGPVAYGETLYQDNKKECHLLGNYTLEVNGIKTSERVKQVAQAYYEGILKYVMNMEK